MRRIITAVVLCLGGTLSFGQGAEPSLYADLGIDKGPETPSGGYARVVEGRTVYVNTTGEEKTVTIRGSKHGLISGRTYAGSTRLKAYDADLVE